MNKNSITILIISTVVLGCFAGGSYLIYRQSVGTMVEATVTGCKKIRRAEICSGSWVYEGKLQYGELENVNSDDLGNKIQMRAVDDRAVKPGLRIPVVLFLIGLAIAVLGWLWWTKEAVR